MARSLKIFMRGKSITLLQETLKRMGYEIADQKGLFGTTTRDAVKNFQKQKALKPTGIVDDALMTLIQGGQAVPEEKSSLKSKMLRSNQAELDALIRLLVKKDIFSQKEWDAERTKVIPSSLV